jgi:hypothetical protein
VRISLPRDDQAVTGRSFRFTVDPNKLRKAELRDGHDLLRSKLAGEDPAVLWDRYVQLTQIEAAFKTRKSELGLPPIDHQVEQRVEAHIRVAFLAYCLTVTWRPRLPAWAPGLTPRSVLEKRAAIRMLDVCCPATDGRWLIMPRYTQPTPEQQILLHTLKLNLPAQPPPRIKVRAENQPAEKLRL